MSVHTHSCGRCGAAFACEFRCIQEGGFVLCMNCCRRAIVEFHGSGGARVAATGARSRHGRHRRQPERRAAAAA